MKQEVTPLEKLIFLLTIKIVDENIDAFLHYIWTQRVAKRESDSLFNR